jgi:hypothetical protein
MNGSSSEFVTVSSMPVRRGAMDLLWRLQADGFHIGITADGRIAVGPESALGLADRTLLRLLDREIRYLVAHPGGIH